MTLNGIETLFLDILYFTLLFAIGIKIGMSYHPDSWEKLLHDGWIKYVKKNKKITVTFDSMMLVSLILVPMWIGVLSIYGFFAVWVQLEIYQIIKLLLDIEVEGVCYSLDVRCGVLYSIIYGLSIGLGITFGRAAFFHFISEEVFKYAQRHKSGADADTSLTYQMIFEKNCKWKGIFQDEG